ncbi:17969_t:CDS:2 [Dentiscutata erythropus]|uniref:17969_t:CDS:1 n=1 Tax=Dentiscutata erythropus TaxID=1348616 RepID=A0A9N9BX85_9GLOM|nr:17969_t:CDS:2 [Dentiscutata erythropus]
MEETENSEKTETIIFFEEEPHTVSEICVSKDGKYIITYDQVNDSLLGWIVDDDDVRADNEIGIFKIERQQEEQDENLLFKITSIKTKIAMIVFNDKGYGIVDLKAKCKIICPSQFYNTSPEFMEFSSIDELIIFAEEEEIIYIYSANFKKNMWIKSMALKISIYMESLDYFGITGEEFAEEMDRIERVIAPDLNSKCMYLITNNGMLLLDRETKTTETRITYDSVFKMLITDETLLVTEKIEIDKHNKTDNTDNTDKPVQEKEKRRTINVKSIRTGLVVRTFDIPSLALNEEDNEKWYIIRSLDSLYIIAFINTNILLLNIVDGSVYVIKDDLNEEIKTIVNENLSDFNIFTIYVPTNTLFGIQDNKILKKNFRNLDFRKLFYNQHLDVLIWNTYLNTQEPDVNLYPICPDIQELKRIKQLPIDALKRRRKDLCIFHFDLNMKSATLQYYWRIFNTNEDSFIPFNLENELFLPRTDFYKSISSGDVSDLQGNWTDAVIEDKFSLSAYGEDLVLCFTYLRASFLVIGILEKWIKWFTKSPRENFHFLKIISILYPELYKSFPEYMNNLNESLRFTLDKEMWCGHLGTHLEGAFILPIITAFCMLQGDASNWSILISIADLLVGLKFILYFRVLESFGAYYAIIIGVAKAIFAFLVMIVLIIVSFGLAFYVLLKPSSTVYYDQPGNQTNDENNPWSFASSYYQVYENGTIGSNPVLIAQPDENEDMFAYIPTSLFAIYGYLADIELFYLLPHQRRWQSWFPNMIYYYVPASEITKDMHEKTKDSEQSVKEFKSKNKALLDLTQYNS